MGWTFYLTQMVMLAIEGRFFDAEYYFTSRLGHVDFIIMHITATFLIIYAMSKKGMLNNETKKVCLLIGFVGFIASLAVWLNY